MIGARSVWSGLCGAQTASDLPNKRLTDGSASRTVGLSVGRALSMAVHVRCARSTFVGFKAFFANFEFSLFVGRPRTKHPQHKTPQLSTASKLLPPTASPANSPECQTYTEEYAPDVSPQGRIPRSAGTLATLFCIPRRRAFKSLCARVRRIALSAD
jgi:hypothetical protein